MVGWYPYKDTILINFNLIYYCIILMPYLLSRDYIVKETVEKHVGKVKYCLNEFRDGGPGGRGTVPSTPFSGTPKVTLFT